METTSTAKWLLAMTIDEPTKKAKETITPAIILNIL